MKQIIGIMLIIFALAGCASQIQPGGDIYTPGAGTDGSGSALDSGIKKFSSTEELTDYLTNSMVNTASYGGAMFGRGVMMESMAMDTAAAPMASGMVKSAAETSAADYSETNVQVQGVDEADFVKNDGKYIYTISGNKLVIVNAFPAEDAKIVFEDEISGNPRSLFVNGDKLVLFVDDWEDKDTISPYDYVPRSRSVSVTRVFVYDISNREKPEVVQEYDVSGNYFEARMIDDYVYFVARDNLYFQPGLIDVPMIRTESALIKPDIYYFDNAESEYVFHTVAGFDINRQDIDAKSYLMGYSNTMMVSLDNIYIAYQKNLPYIMYRQQNEEKFYTVIVPLLPSDIRSKINQIKSDDQLSSQQKWDKISTVLEKMYNSMEKDEKEALVEKISKAIEDYDIKQEMERRKTVIHKINIKDGKVDYDGRGEVNGYLLNQFSMDEFDGNLRVATTTYIYTRDSTMYNNVYVLDRDMDVIGSLEDIAPDERIYSTRFIGDRLYMVTFKNIDPFFVIDLSDATEPTVLGELKIPGYSDYLHPYDENHIIGIGKETEGNEWGGVSTKGLKIALFDVSDVTSPKVVAKIEIGEQGTDSEALNEHKAFLFDKEKNLLVLPVREVRERVYDSYRGYYKWDVWQGAYVFDITSDDISVRGKVEHDEGEDDHYWGSPWAVRRSLYMDDVLYTISADKIKMSDLDTVDEINEVELPYTGYYPVYY
ncbi:MAG: beta-propeller domain-containing protein [Nanoarchaeota archaeon]|nr:beta-propeller domain-containing protein [Nanoarchaeota archaeon]